jgi:hypothetical protein
MPHDEYSQIIQKGRANMARQVLSAAFGLGTFALLATSASAAMQGSLMAVGADQLNHTVPACCIGPHPGDGSPPIPAGCQLQADSSKGGDTVRENNKHCEPHATPGGPNR